MFKRQLYITRRHPQQIEGPLQMNLVINYVKSKYCTLYNKRNIKSRIDYKSCINITNSTHKRGTKSNAIIPINEN